MDNEAGDELHKWPSFYQDFFHEIFFNFLNDFLLTISNFPD